MWWATATVGKPALVSALLFTAGATNRLLRVDEGNTVTDFDEEEIQRKITISTAMAAVEWKKTKINLLDTPGYNIFINDTLASLVAADSALVVVDGVAGVEVQTEKVWSFADDYKLPRAIVVNKLDRERADFKRALESVHETFGRTAVPVQIPIGSERDFNGVVDLIRMKAYTYTPDGDGKGSEGDIPADLADAAQKAHEALVEMVAEGNDALMEEFFDKGTLTPEQIMEGLRAGLREMRIAPVLCASALRNIGSDLILNFVVENLPSPAEREVPAMVNGEQTTRKMVSSDAPALFVFKTIADPFAGRISYFKVTSGRGEERRHPARTSSAASAERLAHIGSPQGKTIQPVTELYAGDIGAVAKLKDTLTGDTLGDKGLQTTYPKVKLPEPSIAFAIGSQVAAGRGPHGQRRGAHPRRGPVAALLPRSADQGVPARRQRPAARRNHRQPPQEALQRGSEPQGAEDPLPRDHPRHRGRPGAPQKADRRTRAVRRLLDQDGAAAARREVRVRQRDLRRLHSQELHPRSRKGHHRGRRERLPRRLPHGGLPRHPLRRLLPRRRFLRAFLQTGRPQGV